MYPLLRRTADRPRDRLVQSVMDPAGAVGTTGTIAGGFPYASVGSGDRPLVVLPGIGDAMHPGVYPPFSGLALAPYFRSYLDSHTVYLLSRPRELARGYDEDDAVEGHARAFEEILEEASGAGTVGSGDSADSTAPTGSAGSVGSGGGVDVIGISMGGLIGQAVARRRPALVDRLVLANSACKLDPDAHDDVRRLGAYARDGDWYSIRSQLARAMFSDGRAVAYPPMIQTLGRFALPRPAESRDVRRSIEFVLSFDGCDALPGIDQPTLVFGGDRDPYFSERLARETAESLPNGELRLVPGAKHGAFHERKSRFDAAVRSFLDRSPE